MPLRATTRQVKLLQHTLDGEVEEVTPKKPRRMLEAKNQKLLFVRKDEFLIRDKHLVLKYLFATLNGVYIPPALVKQVKDCGLVKGVLDIWLPVRRIDEDGNIWSGLVIDLKATKTDRPTPEQLDWARHLVENGYRVYFCVGALDAWWCIAAFLGITGEANRAADLERDVEHLEEMAA